MKTASALIAVIACTFSLSSSAHAEGWKTLAGVNDSVKLAAGETAFVVTVSETTTIQYEISRPGHVRLEIFDLTGRSISVLVDQEQPVGAYHVTFDGQDLSSGTYLYRLTAGSYIETKKMVYMK